MKKMLVMVMALLLAGMSALWAANKGPVSGSWTLEVVDVQCFATEGHHGGQWHKDNCSLKGKELALLDVKKGQLYHPVNSDFMPMREALVQKCGQSVMVTGTIYFTKGVNYLQVTKLK